MQYAKGQEPVLTENQIRLAARYEPHMSDTIFNNYGKKAPRLVPMLTESAAFQPMQRQYNFKKGIARDANGNIMSGKAPMTERTLIYAHKEQVKNELKEEYGANWKHVFHHPKTYSRTSRD